MKQTMDKSKFMIRLLTIVTFLAGIFVRLYLLGVVPPAMQQDESSLGYNAYSIARTLHDEHGVFLPQNFRAFGEYKLPGYIYASVIPVRVFGLSAFSVRLVSALAGILMLYLLYLLASEFGILYAYRKDPAAAFRLSVFPLIVLVHLAVNPWHINFSRAAFESMLSAAFIAAGLLLFLRGTRKKSAVLITFSILSFSLSVYTYNISRLFTPLFVLWLFFIYGNGKDGLPGRIKIWGLVLFAVLLIPFAYGAATAGGFGSTTGTLIFSSSAVQSQLLELRSYFAGWNPLFAKVFLNRIVLTGWYYMNNVARSLSPEFFFVNGGSSGITSTGTTGNFYNFEFPLFFIGLHMLLKKYDKATLTLIGYIILGILVSGITRDAPQSTRLFLLLTPITMIIALGTVYLIDAVKNIRLRPARTAATFIWGVLVLYYLVFYFLTYYVRYPVYYAKNWRTADRDVSLYLKDHAKEYDRIIFDYPSGFMYTSLLTYLSYPPERFQKEAVFSTPDSEGFTHPVRFGNYEFRTVDWQRDLQPGTLIVTSEDRVPSGQPIIKTFRYPQRPVVLNVGQEISLYPTSDPGYALVSVNK